MRAIRLLRGNPWLTALYGLIMGVAVGLAVFGAGRLTGWPLAALIGGFVGLVLTPIFRAYSGISVELHDVKLKIPQFGEASFVLRQDTQTQAHRLYVELSTRVATTPLQPGTGLVEDALGSLYALFTITREVITAAMPAKRNTGPSVLDLGHRMLNAELRPFLSYWRAAFTRWQADNPETHEDQWPDNDRFRTELAELQPRMRELAYAFAKLAGMTEEQVALTWPQDAGHPPRPSDEPADPADE
jgi:hypothetical protein